MLNTLSFQNFFKDLGASYKALAIGIIGGYIGTIIGLPLPWLLGSLGLNLCVAFTKLDIKFPTKLLNPIFFNGWNNSWRDTKCIFVIQNTFVGILICSNVGMYNCKYNIGWFIFC